MLESNHKLITYILKNPPNLNPAAQGSSLTEGKRSKRSKRTNGETNGEKDEETEAAVEAPAEVNHVRTNYFAVSKHVKALLFRIVEKTIPNG